MQAMSKRNRAGKKELCITIILNWLRVIHSELCIIHNWLRVIHSELCIIHNWLRLIHSTRGGVLYTVWCNLEHTHVPNQRPNQRPTQGCCLDQHRDCAGFPGGGRLVHSQVGTTAQLAPLVSV
jgi:hypothetical protein